jgi:hypothetical protein
LTKGFALAMINYYFTIQMQRYSFLFFKRLIEGLKLSSGITDYRLQFFIFDTSET